MTDQPASVEAANPTTCPLCEKPMVFGRGNGACDSCLTEIFRRQRVSDYARALERNGVAVGTIKRLRSIHLEEGDMLDSDADMPAKQSQAMIRAGAKTGHSGDDGEGVGHGVC